MSKITCTHCQSDLVILPWPSVNQDEWSCTFCNREFRPTLAAPDAASAAVAQAGTARPNPIPSNRLVLRPRR